MAHRFGEMDQIEKLAQARIARLATHAVIEGQGTSQDVFHRFCGIERGVGVLEHDLNLAELVAGAAAAGFPQLPPVEDDVARIRRKDSGDRPGKG